MVSATLTRQGAKVARAKTNIFGGKVRSVTWRIDGSPNVAEIEVPRARLEEFRRYNAGKEVFISIEKNFNSTMIFHGWVTGRYIDYSPQSENVSFVCLGPRWRLTNDFIKGQFIKKASGDFGFLTGLRCVFNQRIEESKIAPGNAAKTKDPLTAVRPFSTDPTNSDKTQPFTINDMIFYTYTSKENQGRSDVIGDILTLDEFGIGQLGNYTPYDVDIDSLNIRDALAQVMQSGNLRWWCKPVSKNKSELKAFLNGPNHKEISEEVSPGVITNNKKPKSLNLAKVGSSISGSRNNTNNGNINEDFSEATNEVFVFGERKRFQTTLTLVPGWSKEAEEEITSLLSVGVTIETTEDLSSDWARYKDVGRKWILGEITEDIEGNEITAFDFESLFGSQNYAERRRKIEEEFLNEEGILDLEITNPDLPAPVKFKGNVRLLDGQVGIYIEDKTLSPPLFVDEGLTSTNNFASQITMNGIVREDLSLVKTATTSASQDGILSGLLSEDEKIERRVAHVFEDEYQTDNINETESTKVEADLEERAKRILEEVKNPRVSASFIIPWITTGYEVGDIINGIKGRDIFFTTQVIEVRFDFDAQQTEILAEDIRLASF